MQVYFCPCSASGKTQVATTAAAPSGTAATVAKASLPAGKSSCFLIYLKDLDHEEHLIRLWS